MAKRNIIVDNKKFSISYEILNPNKEKTVIFLHGWGASKDVMRVFSDSFKEFRHIYIDMPGFGKSTNNYILTTKDYAKIIDEFLKGLGVKKEIILGHSFGGKVATLINPKLLVLLGSAGIVMPKPLSIRAKIKLFKLLKKLGLGRFREKFVSSDVKGMSENMYETFKNVVDEDFSSEFEAFKNKAIVFGGDRDSAVPKEAVDKQSKLLNCKKIILNGDHYFFLDKNNRKIIENEVLKHLE
jgi:pimeloyl-ACP methyl ester carboxylesterase